MNRTPEDIVREFQRVVPVMEEEAERAMHEAVDLTHMRMSENAPKGATGALSSKITALVRVNSTGISGTVRPRVKYAKYIDGGSGLYVEYHSAITPKAVRLAGNPRASLKFADGRFRRSSRGTKPTHFIDRTRAGTALEVERILTDGAVKANARLFP